MTLKELRKSKKMTQKECAAFLKIPLRTYQNYETNPSKKGSMKYEFMLQRLTEYGYLDETHGILTLNQIREVCTSVFQNSDVSYCYLFGSYAKGKATDQSDVDLLISTSVSGMQFYDLAETLREGLQKKVDLLNLKQLNNNPELMNEVLKDGIKLYGA